MSDSPSYPENSAASPLTAFPLAVRTLLPTATGSDIAALLDHRAKRTTVLQWMAGRAHAPRWALELLAAKLTARAEIDLAAARMAAGAKERPGLAAGAKNLAAWKARQKR